ncbi:hypothetical protein [Amycolatopsis sp. RTGN1]|uniref:hypothetical protein n=1 Tax=Amycolatopsis ponsaeliensis TaxID=2992142 RepID=UPI00254D9616|nr:hypothetical protein [Amycolatopsis sp. RTGN1]
MLSEVEAYAAAELLGQFAQLDPLGALNRLAAPWPVASTAASVPEHPRRRHSERHETRDAHATGDVVIMAKFVQW